MKKSFFRCPYGLVLLSLLGLMGCYSSEASDSFAHKAIAIDWVEPACAEPGSPAGYIEGTGFGAENVTVTVGGIPAEVLAATGQDASFVVPEGIPPGEPIEVVVMNPGGRLATIQWVACGFDCSAIDCDDGNECTADTCDLSNGTCINDPVANGTLCGTDGVCDAGACRERSWGTPVPVGSGDGSAFVQVAVDPNGNATAVWKEVGIWSNRYTPTSGWGTPVRVGGTISSTPGVAVDPNGNVTVAWMERNGAGDHDVWSNRYTPTTGWGTPVLLETNSGNANAPRVAVDPNGNVTVVWMGGVGAGDNDVWSNRYTPTTGWGTPVLVSPNPTGFYAQVAVDPNGNATVIWQQGPWDDLDIWSNRYTPTTGWGTPVPVATPAGRVGPEDSELVVDPNGNATVVWVLGPFTCGEIWSNRYTPTTGWGTPVPVGTGFDCSRTPQVVVDPNGNATAVWAHGGNSDPDTESGIWSNRYTPTTGWGTPVPVDETPGGLGPKLTVDPNGNVTVVYQLDNDAWANRYTPTTGWGMRVLVATSVTGADSRHSELAADPDGNVTVVSETRFVVVSNRFE